MTTKSTKHLVTTLLSWNDMLQAILCCFLLMVVLLITELQVIKKSLKDKDENAVGTISVTTYWRDGIDCDIDTHLLDPHGNHIWYSNMAAGNWNLVRDDLGAPDARNYENLFSRGIEAGSYVVNVHSFRGQPLMFPLEIEVEVRVIPDPTKGKTGQTIFTEKVTLNKVDEEVTAIRFNLDSEGNVVQGSVNRIFKHVMVGDQR